MTTALLSRLRLSQAGKVKLHVSHYQKDCRDAADEIERLRAALQEARDTAKLDGLDAWVTFFDQALGTEQIPREGE